MTKLTHVNFFLNCWFFFVANFQNLATKKNCENFVGFRSFSAISTKNSQKLTLVIILQPAKFERYIQMGTK